jgi:hypothetical protein
MRDPVEQNQRSMRTETCEFERGAGRPTRRYDGFVVALAVALLMVVLVGCAASPPTAPLAASGTVPSATAPPPPVLSTPAHAVRSYLGWTSYGYRVANSDVASPTMSGLEGVRVDSYVQLNKEQRRSIDQSLTGFAKVTESVVATRVVITAREDWRYRYLSVDGTRALTPYYRVSYDTTYTLIRSPRNKHVWIVDVVEATPLGEVK